MSFVIPTIEHCETRLACLVYLMNK